MGPESNQTIGPEQQALMRRRKLRIAAVALLSTAVLAGVAVTAYVLTSYGPVPCGGIDDCARVGVAPICADRQHCVACDTLRGRCLYRLVANDPGCPCMAGEIRLCFTGGLGSPRGVQRCVAGLTAGTTRWDTCTRLD